MEIQIVRMEAESARKISGGSISLSGMIISLRLFCSPTWPLNQTTQETWPAIKKKEKKN